LGGHADPVRAPGDHLGAWPALPIAGAQSVPAVYDFGEHDGVFECLAGALSQIGGHGVGGVPGQHHVAGCVGRERWRLVQVVAEYGARVRRVQQRRDGFVPAA